MTKNPITLSASTSIHEAAKKMRDADVGAIIVEENGKICGIVTDRDVTIRGIAEDKDPKSTKLSEVCSKDVTTVPPDDDVEHVVAIMRDKAIRRVPVLENGQAVGILSLGDLAIERDSKSALGQISAAPPNR
jgi:CBS domain-containing protein